jgi:hypothetical protein
MLAGCGHPPTPSAAEEQEVGFVLSLQDCTLLSAPRDGEDDVPLFVLLSPDPGDWLMVDGSAPTLEHRPQYCSPSRYAVRTASTVSCPRCHDARPRSEFSVFSHFRHQRVRAFRITRHTVPYFFF